MRDKMVVKVMIEKKVRTVYELFLKMPESQKKGENDGC